MYVGNVNNLKVLFITPGGYLKELRHTGIRHVFQHRETEYTTEASGFSFRYDGSIGGENETLFLYMKTVAKLLYAQRWKDSYICTMKEWMVKLTELAEIDCFD